MQALLITIQHRPYVFVFLSFFLLFGIVNRGVIRTGLFLVLGWGIAFLSEASSIRNGFPYGMYHYVYENLSGEIVLLGVPVWDSLSYSFLAYASYEMAYWLSPPHPSPLPQGERGFSLPFLAAFLMMLLDIVIDPLAARGERWFLGRIFYYPEGGIYFGVPLSNFGGWFLVALAIFFAYQFLERSLERGILKKPPPLRWPILGPLFYIGILIFNLAITVWIGELALAAVGLMIPLVVFGSLSLLGPERNIGGKK